MQNWVRIQCHGVNELIDVTAYRQFYICEQGAAGRWIVTGALLDGTFVEFVPAHPMRKEEAEELLEAFSNAIVFKNPFTVSEQQTRLTHQEHG